MGKTRSKKKAVAKTGDGATPNIKKKGVGQVPSRLARAGKTRVSTARARKRRASAKKKKRRTKGEPVDVISGQVVDEALDLALPGPIPVTWRRSYLSAYAAEISPFGRGGWTHELHQWIDVVDGETVLRDGSGYEVELPRVEPEGSAFHRGERLAIARPDAERWEIEGRGELRTRVFAPLAKGGPAMLREIRDRWGNRVELLYASGRLATVRAFGRELRATYDAKGRILRIEAWAEGAAQQAVAYAYTREGELARATDALGHAQSYAYDAHHRLVTSTLQNGVAFRYQYDDDLGVCVRTTGDGGLHDVELTYDMAAGTTVAADEEVRVYTWNEDGDLLKEATPEGDFAMEYVYDADGLVLSEKNAAGEAWEYEYDARGNRVMMRDPAGNETRWNFHGDLPVRRIAPDGLVTEVTYNREGAPIQVKVPAGVLYKLGWDGAGRLAYLYAGEAMLGSWSYDEKHNLVRETDARGAGTTYTYDPLGRPLTRTDAIGRVTRIEYDALAQPKAVHLPDGSGQLFERDALGNVTSFVDGTGRVTRMEYAGTGALVRLSMPNGQVWRFDYDSNERLREITNPKHERYALEYDRAGRVAEERTFDKRTLKFQWNKSSQVRRVELSDGTWREYAYDPLGNILEETTPHGDQKYERDKLGRLLGAVIAEHSGKTAVKLERDPLGRVVAEIQNGVAVKYAYDAYGRRVTRELPGGETTKYAYDRADAAIQIEHDGYRLSLVRDPLGREVTRRAGKVVEIASTYDARDRLESRIARAADGPGEEARRILSERRFKYDAMGRVVEIDDARWGATHYAYDEIGLLIEAQRGKEHEVFYYDGAGSLSAMVEGLTARAIPWTLGEGNLLEQTESAEYAYDANRRRTKEIDRVKGTTEYFWDARDRLREVLLPSGERVHYTYDAFARRVRKEIVPPERKGALPRTEPERVRVVQFLWDGDVLAQEIDTERGKRVFVHDPRTLEPLLQEEQGEVLTYVNDHLGTPKELVDQAGRVAWSAAHSAWGMVRETWRDPLAKAAETPFRFPGYYFDDETGLSYVRHRYFDHERGRWLSPDPLGIFGGANLNGFPGAPTNDVDPLGLGFPEVDFTGSPALFPISGAQQNIVTIEMQGSRGRDFTQANLAAGFDSTPRFYTWHHVADFDPQTGTCTMQLVKITAHEATYPHAGSVSQFEKQYGVKYGSSKAVDVAEKKGWLANPRRKRC